MTSILRLIACLLSSCARPRSARGRAGVLLGRRGGWPPSATTACRTWSRSPSATPPPA